MWRFCGRRGKSPRCARPGCWSGRPHQLAAAMVRPGVTTAEIDAAVERFFAEHRRRAAVQGRARQGAVSGRHLHLDQRGSGPRHSRPARAASKETSSASTRAASSNGWCGDAAVTLPGRPGRPRGAAAAGRHQGRARSGHRADGQASRVERGGRARWRRYVRDARLLGGRELRRPRHRPRDARRPAGAQLRQRPAPPRRRLSRCVPGPGDRRRADGQHGHEAGPDACPTTGPR